MVRPISRSVSGKIIGHTVSKPARTSTCTCLAGNKAARSLLSSMPLTATSELHSITWQGGSKPRLTKIWPNTWRAGVLVAGATQLFYATGNTFK
jgi:hypothetical protein